MPKRFTQKEFLKIIRKVHGDNYDFSKVIYTNRRTKIIVTCPIHGDFEKSPTGLMQGSGCQECSHFLKKSLAEKLSSDTREQRKNNFIEKAKKIHVNKYDYKKVYYKNSSSKVIITCPIHGEFEQEANSHLQGKGCKKCYLGLLGKELLLSKKEVLERLKNIHGNTYRYTKVHYTGISKPITLICNTHGDFEVLASSVFQGSGCQKCAIEKRRKSNEEFVTQVSEVFGSSYDLSKIRYINTKTRVEVICKKHGSWLSYPSSLLQGHGCRYCGDERRSKKATKTTKEFKKQGAAIHKGKYEYKNVKYIRADVPVEIICPIHGSFEQSPHSHLKGFGCLKCGYETTHKSSRMTRSEFIDRARKRHDNRHNYRDIEYTGLKNSITLKCEKHGEFQVKAFSHLNGKYCSFCTEADKKNTYIEQAKQRHGNKFDYSKVVYKSIDDEITIICKKHGEFAYTAGKHLYMKHGCPNCGREATIKATIERLGLTTETFIEKAQEVHGVKYNYDKVEYVGNKEKVKIYCPKHSFFTQRPNDHLSGSGCQKCKRSKGEELIEKYLKKWKIHYATEFKIPECKNIKPLPFDFAILDLEDKLKGLIEYHGLQHKVPVEFFGGKKSLKQRKKNDKIKENYCRVNNIPLLIIWADNIEKEKKLKRFIEVFTKGK